MVGLELENGVHPAGNRISAQTAPGRPADSPEPIPVAFHAQLQHTEQRETVPTSPPRRDRGQQRGPPMAFGPGRQQADRPPSGRGEHRAAKLHRQQGYHRPPALPGRDQRILRRGHPPVAIVCGLTLLDGAAGHLRHAAQRGQALPDLAVADLQRRLGAQVGRG